MDIYSWILTLAITAGQLIKLPLSQNSGITLLDIAVILLCFLGLLKVKLKLIKPPLFLISAFVFAVIAILSLVLTPLHLRPEETLTSFLYTVRFGAYILLGWLIYSGAFAAFRNNIPRILIFSGLGLAVLGLLQFLFLPDLRFLQQWGFDPHYFRTVSTFLDPNFAGAFFVLTLLLLISKSYLVTPFGYVPGGSNRTPGVFYILFTILYLALLTTFSRSSYLMFLISGITLAYLNKSKILLLSSLLLFTGLMLGFQIYSQVIAEPRNIDRARSASSRFNTWQRGLILFQKSPILGIGYNAYRYGLKQFNLGDEEFLQSHGSSSNDSSLLFVASTTGIIGLAGYLFFLFSLIYSKTITPAILGLIIHSLFANSLFYPPILAWILLISAASKK